MKQSTKTLTIALFALYVVCVLYSAYVLFNFEGALIYEHNVLSAVEADATRGVFLRLYSAIGLTLALGLIAIVVGLRNANKEVMVIQSSTAKKEKSGTQSTQESEEDKNADLDLSGFKAILKKEKDAVKRLEQGLHKLCKDLEIGVGVIYLVEKEKNKRVLRHEASYALSLGESQVLEYEFGEGLVGQVAKEEKTLNVDDIPDDYIKIVSGLGKSNPKHVLITPIMQGKELYGVIELASFAEFDNSKERFVKAAIEVLNDKTDTIKKDTAKSKAGSKKTTKSSADKK